MLREGATLEACSWRDVQPRLRDRLQAAGTSGTSAVQFLVSAHASVEELFVLKQLLEGILGSDATAAVTLSWTSSDKPQPAGAKLKVSRTNAPNVNGARDLGFAVGIGNDGLPDIARLRSAVESGRAKAVYVIDPGPDGSLGDVSWLIAARQNGTLPLLVTQGVLMTTLAAAADIVLPGAAYVEKDATYVNEQGRVQAGSLAVEPPGDALDDWRILVNLGRSLGLTLAFESAEEVRRAIAEAMPDTPYAQADRLVFTRPVPARNWLQASNPSERWKWDFLYQDLPPVKGHSVQMEGVPQQPAHIQLKPIG